MKKYIVYIILLTILEISLALYLTFWRETFWNFVEHKNLNGFYTQIEIFTIVALLFCFVASYSNYLITLCSIKWRELLNDKAYRQPHPSPLIENLNQRIQEDCRDYPALILEILCGTGKAIAYVIVFSLSIAINFNLMYIGVIFIYAIISTFIAQRIAKPLIVINYSNQRAEATYRNYLNSINFKNCIKIMLTMAIKTKHLSYFQTFYSQLAVIIPILIVAPDYFKSALTLGALMQATSTMGSIIDHLSYGITSFNQINHLLSCKKRLNEIKLFDK